MQERTIKVFIISWDTISPLKNHDIELQCAQDHGGLLTYDFDLTKRVELLSRVTGFKVLTWNQVYNVLFGLGSKIRVSGFVPDVIVGICRGGWVPARVLCDLIGVPMLANIGIEFYTGVGTFGRRPRLTQPLSTSVLGKRVLLVDEVVDTGRSLMLAKEHVLKGEAKDVRTVTMYMKSWSPAEPNYYGLKTSSWLVFPWETNETIQTLMRSLKPDKRKEFEDLLWTRLSARQLELFLNSRLPGEAR